MLVALTEKEWGLTGIQWPWVMLASTGKEMEMVTDEK